MKKLVFVAMLAAVMAGCSSSEDAHRALENAGFSNIQITGYNWLSCGKDDFYHTGFIATNPAGKTVEGTVCSGLLIKDATIRF